MKKLWNLPKILVISIIFFTAGCQEENTVPEDELPLQDIQVNNDQENLNSRIKQMDEWIPIMDNSGKSLTALSGTDSPKNITFQFTADVAPPDNMGTTYMATHIDIHENYAFVSYNVKGAEFGGAIEVFDVSDISSPQIISQAIFPTADINAICFDNGKLYFSGATEEYAAMNYDGPAFFGSVNLTSDMQITLFGILIMDVKSYSANDIHCTNDRIFVTSGDDGGVTVFDKQFNILQQQDIFDARSVHSNTNNVFALSGQPGTINVFDITADNLINTINTGGANTPHSKSEIYSTDDYIFVALNEEGVKMFLTDGTEKQHIPKPQTPVGGDHSKHVTNSVSVNNEIVLMGNGESGVAVGEILASQNDEISVLGTLDFADSNSTNFVKACNNILFVASGLGGLKILSITVN